MEKVNKKKVLFYTSTPRFFRTTLIGHFFEICQEWPVVLASEKLDSETEAILKDKIFFPKLEKIVPISQFTGQVKMNLFSQNRYLYNMAKDLIEKEKPDLVVSVSDMHSMFDMYLMRFAKKKGAKVACFQPSVDAPVKTIERWVDFTNTAMFPGILPLQIRIFLVTLRKYVGHFLYYWMLPLLVGQKPFFGKSSYILMRGNSGMRDADYQVVFSKRDFDIYIDAGVPAEKLKILPHPLAVKKTRDFFKKAYFGRVKADHKNKKTLTLLAPATPVGVTRKDWLIIPYSDRITTWLEIITMIKSNLPNWRIFVKPHPALRNFAEIKKEISKISGSIIIDTEKPVDGYLEMADVIVNLPRAASTVIFTSVLQCPGKPVVALDFHHEVLGDIYKDFKGVNYIDNKEDFVSFLKKVGRSSFKKTSKHVKLSDYGTMDLLKELVNMSNKND